MTLQEQAAQRVASGASSTVESAIWSITYRNGYVNGRADAWDGQGRTVDDATEGYRAGYAAGYRWGITHPVTAFAV